MNRDLRLFPILWALAGAAAGLVTAMWTVSSVYRQVYIEDGLEFTFLGGFVGYCLGYGVSLVCARRPRLVPLSTFVSVGLLTSGIGAIWGWDIWTGRPSNNSAGNWTLVGGLIGLVWGLLLVTVHLLAPWRQLPAVAQDNKEPCEEIADMDSGKKLPWEAPGVIHRDCLPHRGPFLQSLAVTSAVLGTLTFCLFPLALIGIPLGISVWVMARRDLRGMAAGRMDPEGERQTLSARDSAFSGFVMALAIGLLYGIIALLFSLFG